MFQDILEAVKKQISTVRLTVKTSENLRDFISRQKSEGELDSIRKLIQEIPDNIIWANDEHCAVVTRLYSIYERFAEDLVRNWLLTLPKIYVNYSDLDERIKNTHKIGVGKLLINLNKNRYKHLSITDVMKGIYLGETVDKGYQLLPDAFLIHEQNLRREILEQFLADAGILNAWSWIDKHREVQSFIKKVIGRQINAEDELLRLINYRNEAAHGTPKDILNSESLLELCSFVEALCEALTELMTYQVIQKQESVGQAIEIGTITEWFKTPKAAIVKMQEITSLSVGGSVFLVSEAYCQLAQIENIQVNNESISVVQTALEMEVGLKFDIDAKRGLRVYQCF
jgi:hypothetical protein